MSQEQWRSISRQANSARPISWPQNIRADEPRISFRDLAKLAFPIKTIEALGALTGASRSSIKYWLAGTHEPPASVLAIVVGEIMRRLTTSK